MVIHQGAGWSIDVDQTIKRSVSRIFCDALSASAGPIPVRCFPYQHPRISRAAADLARSPPQ